MSREILAPTHERTNTSRPRLSVPNQKSASTEQIYQNPLHPYTESLLSAIPEAEPLQEKERDRMTYEGMTYSDSELDELEFVEIAPEHFVLCLPSEVADYKRKYTKLRTRSYSKQLVAI